MRVLRFKVWRTVTVGVYASIQEDIDALEAVGMILSPQAYYLFNATGQVRSRCRLELDLVMPTLSELGFTSEATFVEVSDRVVDMGMDLTPWEAALDGRRRYGDQPITRERTPFIMKPFFSASRAPCTLTLSHDEGFPPTLSCTSVAPKVRIAPHKHVLCCQSRT